ncbi:MAG: cytidine deaminase [Bacillota bacterium]|nr:cytidine deaminase [Bacillota bacterium]
MSTGECPGLVRAAAEARRLAYCPYSEFAVGAALLTTGGRVYCGCNIENASYSVTVCAERVALFAAVSAGERDLEAMAVVADGAGAPRPCGPCLQALAEFAPRLRLYLATADGAVTEEKTLDELLPQPFGLRSGAAR